MLSITGQWEGLDQAFAALEEECEAIVRGIAIEAWNYVLRQTPQFFGDAVASWSFSVVTPKFVDRSNLVDHPEPTLGEQGADEPAGFKFRYDPEEIKQKGHSSAIEIANLFVGSTPWTWHLGQEIWFANGVDYSAGLEDGSIRLRAVNRPGQMASRALDNIQTAYGDQVSPRSVNRLKGLTIG
jgi:hypothetical protein